MASAMGYSNKSITKAFGDLIYGDDNPNTIKELLHELNVITNKKT
jgi:hypothetical protein